jgi:hypothetical protein
MVVKQATVRSKCNVYLSLYRRVIAHKYKIEAFMLSMNTVFDMVTSKLMHIM